MRPRPRGAAAGRPPDGSSRRPRRVPQSIDAADRLGCPRLNLHGTGLDLCHAQIGEGNLIELVGGRPRLAGLGYGCTVAMEA
ncbi:hypothetical protein [Streptomyces sp. NPDC001714]|uniref:hypothetical protein n=1 Tax=Streptomyces sp. NPDC001714 TaxID=3364603 RepID=UPI00367489F4